MCEINFQLSCYLAFLFAVICQNLHFFFKSCLPFIKIALSLHLNCEKKKGKEMPDFIDCENSSVGRARPCQGRGRGFESRFSLSELIAEHRVSHFFSKRMSVFVKSQMLIAQMVELVDTLVSGTSGRKVVGVRVPLWVQIIFIIIKAIPGN